MWLRKKGLIEKSFLDGVGIKSELAAQLPFGALVPGRVQQTSGPTRRSLPDDSPKTECASQTLPIEHVEFRLD